MENKRKTKVAIVGGTGYTGQELLRLLSLHPAVELVAVTSRSYAGKEIAHVFPNLRKSVSIHCSEQSMEDLALQSDLIFLALPHGEAASMVTNEILQSAKVIDLGADFRLANPSEYKEWYHLEHANPDLLKEATYGLCELNRKQIQGSRLIANPGCYATCSILALTPLLKANLVDSSTLIIDAKSGVSGAGRGLALGSHFNECNENIKAYALASHRHTPEIEQELQRQSGLELKLSFTPHLVPMQRGILVTAYANLNDGVSVEAIQAAYDSCYTDSQFIRLYPNDDSGVLPETRWVTGSNYCDIALRIDQRTNRIIVIAALDNLVKGAAGQAIQNMNLMCGFKESTGLEYVPIFP